MIHITIIGMKPNQTRTVQSQYGQTVRFTFLSSDRSSTRLPPATDWVIATRFIQHRWSVAARKFPDGVLLFVPGVSYLSSGRLVVP